MEMNASACGANGAIDLRNSASLHLRATLFGLSFDLLDGNGETRFKTGWNNNQPAGTAAVTIPLLGDMAIPPLGYEQNFIGPSVIIPVGPIPVTIKSGLFAKLSLGAQQSAFDPWPAACGSSDSGSMGFQVGASAYASVWATASIDAIVAEAGIKAELVLANDSIGMGVKTAVTPAKNEVIVAPGFNYTLQHLAGRFSVFFDIDLLFYSKRYEYVFYEFAGFTTPPPGPTGGKIFAAIDPSKMTP
jgi:hypothetical protein